MNVQKQIFELVYYTHGGISYNEAYFTLPVYLRNFHYKQLVSTLKAERDAMNSKSSRPDKWTPPPEWAFNSQGK